MAASRRIMTLRQAITQALPQRGLYLLLRQGRALYAGQTSNLHTRMIHYYRMARILGCDSTQLTVRLTYMNRATPEELRALERRYIRRITRVRPGQPNLINVQANREWEW